MDGGAWWAAVHEVAKNQTRLSDFTFFPLGLQRPAQGLRLRHAPGGSVSGAGGAGGASPGSGEDWTPSTVAGD